MKAVECNYVFTLKVYDTKREVWQTELVQSTLGMCSLEHANMREEDQMDVTQLVRLPNGNHEVMDSTPTLHSGI